MYNSPKKPSRLKKHFSELTVQSFAIIIFNLIGQTALNIRRFFNVPFLSPYILHTDTVCPTYLNYPLLVLNSMPM